MQADIEYSVEDTNADAMSSKISAIKKGYFEDKFAELFVRSNSKKDVLINRGYWSRVEAFRSLIKKFLLNNPETKKQIISIGCGYDTLFFVLKSDPAFANINFKLFEMDLSPVVKNKMKIIKESAQLLKILKSDENLTGLSKDESSANCYLESTEYVLFSGDLRKPVNLKEKIESHSIDYKVPTLVFAECVLAYIEADFTDQILKNFADDFSLLWVLDYEMFNPKDSFGKMMLKNFELKGCPLLGITDYPDADSIKKRYERLGYLSVEIYDMLKIYNDFLDKTERKRIERLELMDEFEEWNIMQKHYFISLSFKMNEEIQQLVQLEEGRPWKEFIEKIKLAQ